MGVGYRLDGGKGFFYVVQMYPGCRDCTAPPGIIIRRITKGHDEHDYLKDLRQLPAMKINGATEFTIKCGLDPDEFVKAVCKQVKHGGFIGEKILIEDGAHDLADLVWDEAINRSRCGRIVAKDLSVRVHVCECGLSIDRDVNAARNILKRALTPGAASVGNAQGELASTPSISVEQADSLNCVG
jgi:hypothetical protein